MDTLFHKLGGKIKGVIEGFDRIIFKGMLKPISYAAGMSIYLGSLGILNKDYKDWVQDKTVAIIRDADEYSMLHSGRGYHPYTREKRQRRTSSRLRAG